MIITNQLVNYSELNISDVQTLSTFPYNDQAGFYPASTPKPIKRNDLNPITATQIIVLLLFIFGIFFALIMYCKTCSKSYQERCVEERECRNERDEHNDANSLCYYTIQDSRRDRPPSYSEACGAPPLYGSPFNRASMLEPPPVYPDTPKLPNRSRDQVLPMNCHM